jgi:hypothetical protein
MNLAYPGAEISINRMDRRALMKTLLAGIAALILFAALAGCADFAGKTTDESIFTTLDHMRANPD